MVIFGELPDVQTEPEASVTRTMTRKSKAQIRRDIIVPEVFSELNSKAECGICEILFDSVDALVDHVWSNHNDHSSSKVEI